MKLDFNETYILNYILTFHFREPGTLNKSSLITDLEMLIKNTEDELLKSHVHSLLDKIYEISEIRLKEVYADVKTGRMITTKQYNI